MVDGESELIGTVDELDGYFSIEVEDIEALYQEIKSKTDVMIELNTAWYGMREFYVKDCNGYILGFAESK